MKEKSKEDRPELPEVNSANRDRAAWFEVSGEASKRAPQDVTRAAPPPPPPPPRPPAVYQTAPGRSEQARQEVLQDPRAISASLRRVRSQSDSLIRSEAKQGRARAGEGYPEGSGEGRPPVSANVEKKGATKVERSASPAPGPQSKGQALPLLASPITSASQSVARRTTGTLSAIAPGSNSSLTSSVSSPGMRINPGLNVGPPQLPANGPASVLAQASGLKPPRSKFRAGMIIFAILVVAGLYFIVRDNLLGSRPSSEGERNLVRAEDQSEQSIKLGDLEREKGNFDEAIAHFRRALELTPNSQQGRFLLGLTYIGAKQEEEALKVLQALLRNAPEHLDARLQVAEIYRMRGDWDAAYQELQRIIAFDQKSTQAQYALEIIEKNGLKELEAIDANARNGRDRRQQKKNSPVLPASTIASVGAPIMAVRVPPGPSIPPPASVTSPSVDENPDPRSLADSHKKLGVRYLVIREYRAAIKEFLAALQLTPNDKDLYYFIGSSYNGLNQLATAHEYYRRVDSGPYVGPAQSGARQTEKAARDEFKRREQMKNEVGKETGANSPDRPTENGMDE